MFSQGNMMAMKLSSMSKLGGSVKYLLQKGYDRGFNDDTLSLGSIFFKDENSINDESMPEFCECLHLLMNKVKVINLSNQKITMKGVMMLFDTIKKFNKILHGILLNNISLGDDLLEYLGQYMQFNKELKLLSLKNTGISDKGIVSFSKHLSEDASLIHFDISSNKKITNASSEVLLLILRKVKIEYIQLNETSVVDLTPFNEQCIMNVLEYKSAMLDLNDRRITDQQLDKVCEFIKIYGCNELKEIRLQKNHITSKGMKPFLELLRQTPNKLIQINVADNKLDVDCMQEFAELIYSTQSLEHVNLRKNMLDNVAIKEFTEKLIGNKTLKSLILTENSEITDEAFEFLNKFITTTDIELVDIRNTRMKKVKDIFLATTKNVIEKNGDTLQLFERNIEDKDVDFICSKIKNNPFKRMKELNFWTNRITSKGATLLFKTLKQLKFNVSKINISENKLDDECISDLGSCINSNPYIEYISIGFNNFTDKGVDMLCKSLFGNKTLKIIEMVKCKGISDNSFPILAELARKTRLKDISIYDTSISLGKQRELKDLLDIPIEMRDGEIEDLLSKPKLLRKSFNEELIGFFDSSVIPGFQRLVEYKNELLHDLNIFDISVEIDVAQYSMISLINVINDNNVKEFRIKLDEMKMDYTRLKDIEMNLKQNGTQLSNANKRELGKLRDKIRGEVVRNYMELKHPFDEFESVLTFPVWNEFGRYKQALNKLKSKTTLVISEVTSSPLQNLDTFHLRGDWLIETKEVIDDIVMNVNIIRDTIENANRFISQLHNRVFTQAADIEIKLFNLLDMKKSVESNYSKMKQFMMELQVDIEKEIKLFEKRNDLGRLYDVINKKNNYIISLTKTKGDKQVDLNRKRESLTSEEIIIYENQIKEIDENIKALKLEYEDIIEEFNEKCMNESEDIMFPDLMISNTNESSTDTVSTSQNELIRIPKLLTVRSTRCELLSKVGDGGFSSVFKMKMRSRKIAEVALLAFKKFNMTYQDDFRMIEREVEMISLLKHDNIVNVVGVIGNPYAKDVNDVVLGIGIVMDFCENGSLRSLLNKNTNNNQQQLLSMDLIIHLLLGAAQGLEYLHNHIPHAVVHGDIKSDNILIDKEYNAKLCDFGISKVIQSSNASSTTTRGGGGTLTYKAPETFNGKIERASDVYSFGCVILELLTGERPWSELGNDVGAIVTKVLVLRKQHDLSKVRKDVKEELIDLMKRCLDYDKDKRPTMNEVRMELEKMMNNAVLIELDNTSDEYNKVENLFFPGEDKEGSLNRENYRIVKIDKIRHLFAERRYDAELSNIKSILNDDGANERLLFHGTSQKNPMQIINNRNSFMKDHSSGGYYGVGLYFAELARYANGKWKDSQGKDASFRYNIPNTNQYQMLVCSVICGKSMDFGINVSTHTKSINAKTLSKEMQSVQAGPHYPGGVGHGDDDSRMIVVYKDIQVAVKYLITYEKLLL